VFSSQYGLPARTTGTGCFTKVNQTGGWSGQWWPAGPGRTAHARGYRAG
jgi:hypothetical protein